MEFENDIADAPVADAGAAQDSADVGAAQSAPAAPAATAQAAAPADPWGGWDYKTYAGDLAKVPETLRPVLEHVTTFTKQQALAENKQQLEAVNAELAALKQQKADQGGQLTARQRAEQAELEKARVALKTSEDQIKALAAEKTTLEARTAQAEHNAKFVEATTLIGSCRDYLIPAVADPFFERNFVFPSEEAAQKALVWAVKVFYDSPAEIRPDSVEQAIDMAALRFGGRAPADTTGASAVTTSPQGGSLQPTPNTSLRSLAAQRQIAANIH